MHLCIGSFGHLHLPAGNKVDLDSQDTSESTLGGRPFRHPVNEEGVKVSKTACPGISILYFSKLILLVTEAFGGIFGTLEETSTLMR